MKASQIPTMLRLPIWMIRSIDCIRKYSTDAPNTIWVLIADHGEAFEGQHGETSHGLFLYDETMRIPWIIQPYPALTETKSLSTPASSSMLPLLFKDYFGVTYLFTIDGIDAISNERTEPVYMESNTVQQRFGYHPEIGLSDGQHKLMPTVSPHLYDLQNDPNETNNLWSSDLSSEWNAWYTQGRTLYSSDPKFSLETPDASVMKQLEALGYMGGSNGNANDISQFDIDAKERLETIAELNAIVASRRSDPPATPEEIISRFEALLKTEPQLERHVSCWDKTYAIIGRKDDAVRTFEEALSSTQFRGRRT